MTLALSARAPRSAALSHAVINETNGACAFGPKAASLSRYHDAR